MEETGPGIANKDIMQRRFERQVRAVTSAGRNIKMMLGSTLSQLIIAFALLTLISVWAFTLSRIEFEHQADIRSTMRANDNLVAALEEHITGQLDNFDELLLFLKQQYETNGSVNEAIIGRIQSTKSTAAMQVSLFDSQGRSRVSLLPNAEKIDVSGREYFKIHANTDTGNLYVGKPVKAMLTGRNTFHLSRRLNQADGSFGGVVACAIEPQYFSDFYRGVKLGTGYSITILGRDGVIRLRQTAKGMESGQDVSDSQNFHRMQDAHSGSYISTSVVDFQSRIFSFHHMDRYPLIVQVSVLEEEALSDFREREAGYRRTAVVSSVVVLFIFGLLLFMTVKQERISEARQESEDRFGRAFINAPIGMALESPEGRWLKVNDRFCRMLGYWELELLALTVQQVTQPEDADVYVELRRQMLAGEIETYSVEKRYCHKSGRAIPCLLTSSLVRDSQGMPLYFISQIEDISVKKLAEQKAVVEEKRLRAILHISQLETSSTKELLEQVLIDVVDLSESRLGYIYYYSEDKEEFALHAWSQTVLDECGIADRPSRYKLEETGLWGEAVRQRRPIIDNDFAAAGFLKKGYPEGHLPLTRFMTVPVFVGKKIVAVVGVANKKAPYTELDAGQLTLLMDSIWNLIERRQAEEALRLANEFLERKVDERTMELLAMNGELEALNEELQRLTLVDGLTGIANRRYFDEYLEREWRAGLRYQKPLSLIMADVDFFKSYNDNYGHQCGDDCLKTVAGVLANGIKRATDLAARYGGEEFAVVLPDTDLDGAMVVAETIRRRVEELGIKNRDTQRGVVTVSFGVASQVPSREASQASLIAMADKALYQAKHSGRNQVTANRMN